MSPSAGFSLRLGDVNRQYATWEVYFSGSLAKRIYYFFRKHADGKIVVAVAEWPGTVSEDGLSLIPPPLPQGVADDPEEDRPAVPPGTGYPEDDPADPEPFDT